MSDCEEKVKVQPLCYYLLPEDKCGVTMPREKACCPCPDYRDNPDPFWEACKSGE